MRYEKVTRLKMKTKKVKNDDYGIKGEKSVGKEVNKWINSKVKQKR